MEHEFYGELLANPKGVIFGLRAADRRGFYGLIVFDPFIFPVNSNTLLIPKCAAVLPVYEQV